MKPAKAVCNFATSTHNNTTKTHTTMETIDEHQAAAIYGGTGQPETTAPEQERDTTDTEASATEATASEAPDIEALIKEAEQRGYRRGREDAEAEIAECPAMWQPATPTAPATGITDAAYTFLSGLRPGVWDR